MYIVRHSSIPHRPTTPAIMQTPSIAFRLCVLLVLGLVDVRGRIIERCQLARELRQFGLPCDQIATWVCIAQRESSLDTAAIGRLNTDGSADHGLFQINDRYWCSPPGTGKGCGITCDRLRTDDIGESVKCLKTVYEETQRLKGNGFEAWMTYKFCTNPPSLSDC